MPMALDTHDRILDAAVSALGGVRILAAGDAIKAVFDTARDAVQAAIDAQRQLAAVDWQLPGPIRVRMAVHVATGGPELGADFRSSEQAHLDALISCGHGGQILMSRAVAGTISPENYSLLDLGIYRLPDTNRGESIYQVCADGLPAHFPPLRAIRIPETNLDLPPNRLIGRTHELQAIQDLLYGKDARLVTLIGPGGIGKTRLAHQLALDLRDERDETVWFVDLVPTTDSAQVVAAIATALRTPEQGFASPFEALIASLRGHRTVLVLDNFEHLLPAADTVAELLARLPELRVVVTSRGPLQVRGEWQFPVEPLSMPGSVFESWEELIACESVQLLVDRVADFVPHARLGAGDSPAVAGICQKLEGVPLAIELAAPLVRVLTVEELNDRLEDRLSVLAPADPTGAGRHRAMRASISWSYELLAPESQAFFRQLGLLQSGFTLETAEGLLGDRFDVLAQVETLVEQNLVRSRGFQREAERFVLLESVRQFALELLEDQGELASARKRHARYFATLVLDRYPDPRDYDAAAVDHLRAEMDDIQVAIEWLAANEPARSLDMAVGSWRLWFVTGQLAQADRWLGLVLDAATAFQTVARVRALYGRALLAHARAFLEYAVDLDRASWTLAESLGDDRGIGDACNHLAGITALATGDNVRALELVEVALAAYERIDDRHGIAETHFNRAAIAYDLERFDDALRDGLLVIDYCRAEGKDVLASNALHAVAGFAIDSGQDQLARELLRDGLEISRRLGYDVFLSANVSVVTTLLVTAGRYEDALRLAEFARTFTRDVAPGGDVADPFHRVETERAEMLANLSPEVAERAIAAGQTLSPADAVEQGLELLSSLPV